MRIDFDHTTPLAEQYVRAGNRKKVGRKHDQRLGPTRYGVRAAGHQKFRTILAARRHKRGLQIGRYWRCERDTHP